MADLNETMIQGTKVVSGNFVNFDTPREVNIKSLKVYFSPKQAGTGTPSPTNVRPISGWTGVEVGHCGKNLFDKDSHTITTGNGINYSTGGLSGLTASSRGYTDYIAIKGGEQYTLSSLNAPMGIGSTWGMAFYDLDKTYISGIANTNSTANEKSFIAPDNAAFFRATFTAISSVEDALNGIQLEIGSTATAYEPYKTKILLPKEYQEVEYLESSGTQYIDLDKTLNVNDYYFYFKVMPLKVSGNATNSYNGIMGKNSSPQVGWYNGGWTVGNASSTTPDPPVVGQIYELEYSKDFDGNYCVDGQETGLRRRGSMSCYLFYVESRSTNAIARLYKAYAVDKAGGYVYNLIPCYRISNSTPGMYDTVSGKFYTNSGTGNFILGPEVHPYSVDWSEDVGTVYGGYVDLVSGELVETWKHVTMDNLWNQGVNKISDNVYKAMYAGNTAYTGAVNGYNDARLASMCSISTYVYNAATANKYYYDYALNQLAGRMQIVVESEDDLSTAAAFTQYLRDNNFEAVHIMKTPITHHLSPAALTTLLHTNNIWSNADRIEVEYEFVNTFDALRSRKNIMSGTPHTETLKGNILTFGCDMVSDLKECKVWFKPKQSGEGTPSPDNVRPIEGWDGIEITRCGKNLYPYSSGSIGSYQPTYLKAGQTYTFSANTSGNPYTKVKYIDGTTSDMIWLSKINSDGRHYNTFIPVKDTVGAFIFLAAGLTEPSIEIGSTATSYEPYQSTSLTIPFGKTIYGGYVDLVKGEVVEEYSKTTFGTGWAFANNNINSIFMKGYSARYPTATSDPSDIVCDSYATYKTMPISQLSAIPDQSICARSTYRNVFVRDNRFETPEDFAAAMSNTEFTFRLATPVSYPLTPQSLATLRGANTIYTNSNDETEITYYKHGDDAYTHIPGDVIVSNDNFIIVTDDGYVIGDEQDYIIY